MPDLERAIGARELSDEEHATVAGLVLLRMGRLPHLGESVAFGGYRFEIADLDSRRIDKVIVTRLPREPEMEL